MLPADSAVAGLIGGPADRAARNRLQVPWLATLCEQWASGHVEVRSASGPVPQGAVVARDAAGVAQRVAITRRSILRIVKDSGRLDDFKKNPQAFIEVAASHIHACKRLALVDGIVYKRVGGHEFYAQEWFEQEQLTGYVENMLRGTEKCVFESVVYDSTTERDFAQSLEDERAVKIYAKLPRWFQIKTPLGSYNPDWAVVIEEPDGDRLYFVVETKGSVLPGALRATEAAKSDCGKAHFESLADGTDSPAQFKLARVLEELLTGD